MCNSIWQNKYEWVAGKVDISAGGQLLHTRPADAAYALTRWQHLTAWNDITAAILKIWRRIENRTPSIATYIYLKNIKAKFHPDPIWNDGALGFFEQRRPTRTTTTTTTTTRWVAIWVKFLFQKDLSKCLTRRLYYATVVEISWRKAWEQRCVQQGSRCKPLQMSTLFDTTLA